MCGGPALDIVSDVIGTGGGDQGLLNVVDEGVQSVGSGLAEVDDFVNEEIPGGWATVAAVAAPQLAPLLTGAALTAAEAAALSAGVSGTSSIIQGDPLDVALQKAALSGAGSYGSQYLLGGGSEFTGASETGLATLAGEGVAADVIGATLLGYADATALTESATNLIPTSIDQAVSIPDVLTADDLYTGQAMTDLSASYDDATRLADLVKSFENPTELTGPTIDVASRTNVPINLQDGLTPTYDFSPEIPIQNVSPEYDPTSYLNIPEPTPVYDFSPNVPIEYVSPEYDPTGSLYTEARAPIYDFSPTVPVEQVSPELDPTGSLATSGGLSITQALRGLNAAKGLLGSGQEQALAPATQFRGTRVPQGQVDYSGILSLLQMQSPQRRSLLG